MLLGYALQLLNVGSRGDDKPVIYCGFLSSPKYGFMRDGTEIHIFPTWEAADLAGRYLEKKHKWELVIVEVHIRDRDIDLNRLLDRLGKPRP